MPERYLVQNPRVAWRVYDGEAFLISPDDSTLHALNAVGTLIWEAADGRTAVEAIVQRICRDFEVGPEQAVQDLEAFADELTRRGLLTVHGAPEGGTG